MITTLLFLWKGVRVRFIVSAIKADVQKCTVGSNPTLSIIFLPTSHISRFNKNRQDKKEENEMANTDFVDLEGNVVKTSSMEDEHQIIKITEKTPELKNIGKIVTGDTNSNILTFEINRYYDKVDLLTKNIKFIVKNELGMFTEDAVNLQYNDNLLRFSWILSDSVTYKSGIVFAAIIFLGTESGTNYALKTLPFTIKIENSLDFMEYAIEYKDWFTDIEIRLLNLEDREIVLEERPINFASEFKALLQTT